jgi:CCR4-NOT transcriptional regulation complex NOT5 subunit
MERALTDATWSILDPDRIGPSDIVQMILAALDELHRQSRDCDDF